MKTIIQKHNFNIGDIRTGFEKIGNLPINRKPTGEYINPQRQLAWEFFKHGFFAKYSIQLEE